MTIAEDDLARLEAMAQAATPGTHEVQRFDQASGEIRYQVEAPLEGAIVASMDDHDSKRAKWDAELFAEARESIIALVAEVREMHRHAANMAELLSEARQAHDTVCAERDALRAENQRLQMLTAGIPQLDGWRAGIEAERDALRAENDRLRNELADAWHTIHGGPHEGGLIRKVARLEAENDRLRAEHVRDQLYIGLERGRTSNANGEAAELRASLADAVAKIAHMEPVVEAARAWRREHEDTDWICCHPLAGAVDAYEALLTAKETP